MERKVICMTIYVVTKEDHGYLGYGPEIGCGVDIESVHRTYMDALVQLRETYGNLSSIEDPEAYGENIKGIYRYFDESSEHAYEFWIYEKELA